jgi:hypothetical protein
MKAPVNQDCRAARCWHARPLRVLAAILMLVPAGCIIPTPGLNSGAARRNIGKQTPGQFQPGKTTRAELMLALGEPDAVSPDERKLAYRSEKIAAIFLVGAGYSGGGGSIERDEYLVFEFDARDRLQKTERSSHWFGSADPERKLGLTASATRRDSNIRIETRASWLSGVDDYRSRGFVGAEWLPGRLVLTDTHLRFFSKSKFGNEAAVFSLPYTALAEAREDKVFIGRLLALRTRAGQHYAFQIWGDSTWSIDRAALQKIQQLLGARIQQGS